MDKKNNIYWGDVHNHCKISYGHGRLEHALVRARQQLDFCSVTGHAFWHDIPKKSKELSDSVNYHFKGFDKLKKNWEYVQKTIADHNIEKDFLTFLSYEWHSSRYGDHCIYYLKDKFPLLSDDGLESLGKKISSNDGIIIPHHIAYKRGYRGFDWNNFNERISPLVEIFSMHGCSESDLSPYPYLHLMGPKDYHGTAEYGLNRGNKFGFIASSDHNDTYPGSWGDGRMAVYAPSLTKGSIWKSMLERKTYAVTGDKIKVFFDINGVYPGEFAETPNKREINISLETEDFLDRVELVKNGRTIKYLTDTGNDRSLSNNKKVKVRLEWGWGFKDRETKWQGKVNIKNGEIIYVEPCFRGRPVLSPEENDLSEVSLPHEICSIDRTTCSWTSTTIKNPTNLHPATQSLIFKLEIGADCRIKIDINGTKQEIPLESLLKGSQSFYTEKNISEAFRLHRAIPKSAYRSTFRLLDEEPEQEIDYYYLRIAQRNNQWAWVTPIWVIS